MTAAAALSKPATTGIPSPSAYQPRLVVPGQVAESFHGTVGETKASAEVVPLAVDRRIEDQHAVVVLRRFDDNR